MIEFILGFIVGILFFVGYGAFRALRSDGWDDSNMLNWLRLLSHCYIHPEDFGQMYYLNSDQVNKLIDFGWVVVPRPFSYISGDEFQNNFRNSRP